MSWRFALRPKWIMRHVAVVTLVVAMVLLGLWQLRRLDEKRAYGSLVQARQDQPVADVRDVVPSDARVDDDAIDAVLYRKVSAMGTYEDDDTVVVENRTLNGASGAWVLTPLRLEDGAAVVVNRGFIGFDREGAIVPPAAPRGSVIAQGLLFPSQRRGSFGPTDPQDGELEVLARVDLDRLEAQVDYQVLPAYLHLVGGDPDESPTTGDVPALVPLGPPELEEGPHLSYAVQWFIFSTIAAGGYGLLLRRVARDHGKEVAAATADADVDRELAELLDAER